jgi:hypothetical protein
VNDPEMKDIMEKQKNFFEGGGFEFLSALEEKFDCASMCSVPLFYLQKNVNEGPVDKECIKASLDALSNNMSVAIAFSVTSFILIIAFFGSIPLCGKSIKQPVRVG